MKELIKEFKEFLKEYKVTAIAIAFIMGSAVNTLVQSLVNDVVMPVITPFVPKGEWKQAELILGPIVIKWGSFLSALINFLLIAFLVFMVVRGLRKK